jgi:hypothetical protein
LEARKAKRPAPERTGSEPRAIDLAGQLERRDATFSRLEFQAEPIRAELSGADTCTVASITATAPVPALALCRELLAAGIDPDRALEVYRAGTLALRVRSIGAGAKLAVREDDKGTRFVRHRPGPDERARGGGGEAPPIAPNDCPAIPMAEANAP